MSQALFAAKSHIDFALTEPALPRKQTKQGKEGALDHAFAWKAAELLMATGRAGMHENLNRL
jgi:hypothetical protein